MIKFQHCALVVFVSVSLLLGSCISRKSTTYINNLPQSDLILLDSLTPPPPIIFANDVLDIRIGGENPATVQYINQYFGSGASAAAGASGSQFIVDVHGDIEVPKIGKVRLIGLTRDAARDTLTRLYSRILVDPIVSVKFSNFRFSVIGEVRTPGTYNVPSDKINIFEALAQAGDITEYGRIENVRVLRDNNGKRKIITLNLTDKSILNSENYYINRYDLIYVEARPLKSVTNNLTRTANFIGIFATILALILVLKK